MAEKRDAPYVWVTWMPQIMLGSRVCHWGPWFKTHYKGLPRPAPDHKLAVRTTEHAERVGKLSDMLLAAGRSVSVESENGFRVRRGSLTVGGKADIVCWDAKGDYTVYDVKTGAKKDSDVIQVMLYMALLPYSKRFRGKTFAGSIIPSEGGYMNIPATAVDDAFRQRVGHCLNILAAPIPPEKRPSAAECRFCDVARADCPEKLWLDGGQSVEDDGELPF